VVDQIACVTFTTPASPGTLDITSGSITDSFSAVILIFTRQQTDDSNVANAVLGVGFIGVDGTDGTTSLQCSIAIQSEDGVTSSQDNNTDRNNITALLASNGVSPATAQIVAVYSSSVAGGVKLNFTTTTVQAKCTAILFAGLSKAATGNCSFNDVAGSHADVGLSPFWQPDVVIFRSSDNIINGDTDNGTLALGFAVRTSPIKQAAAYINFDDLADPTDSDGYVSSTECSVGFVSTIRTWPDRFSVTSFDSTGFNGIAVDDPSTGTSRTPQANYLALKFSGAPSLFAGNLSVSGSAGTQSFTGIGFQPQLVIGMSTLMASLDTLTSDATSTSAGYFAFMSSYARAYSVHNQAPLNIGVGVPTDANTHQGDYAVLTLTATGTIAQKATLSQMTSSGFDLSFSTATAGFLTVLAIGSGTLTSVQSETERISDASVVNLISRRIIPETEQISDNVGGLILADGLSALGPIGYVFQGGAEQARVQQGGIDAATVDE